MSVRAKFKCTHKAPQDDEGAAEIRFEPVIDGSAENADFFKWTPWGDIRIGTVNPRAAEQFVEGKEYYVDFTPAQD